MGCAAALSGAERRGTMRCDLERCDGAIATICPDKEGTDTSARPKNNRWVMSGWIRSSSRKGLYVDTRRRR